MRLLLIVGIIVAVLVTAGAAPQGGNDLARIEGVVLDAATRQPLANVRIRLIPGTRSANTGVDGRFVLDGVAPGDYVLHAARAGYMAARWPGRRLPGNSGIPVTAVPGQRLDGVLELFPAAIVSGRVTDNSGRPLQGIAVTPFRYSYGAAGELEPTRFTAVRTNDLGEFRFNDLDPGEYRFRIEPPLTGSMYYALYYPAFTNIAQAAAVQLASGIETRLADVRLPAAAGGALRVRLSGPEEIPQSGASIFYRRRGDAGGASITSINPVVRLSPGLYDVHAFHPIPGAGPVSGVTAVEILDADVEAAVEVAYDVPLTGRAITQPTGETPSRPVPGVAIQLIDPLAVRPVDARPRPPGWTSRADGSLALASTTLGLGPGRYRVEVANIPQGMYVAAILYEGRDVASDWIVVERGRPVDVTVILGGSPGTVQGRVLDSAGQPVPGAVVAMISEESGGARRYVSGRSSGHGVFELQTPPGVYQLYAWTELDGAAYRNAEFMSRFEGRGEAVAIAPGETATRELAVLEIID